MLNRYREVGIYKEDIQQFILLVQKDVPDVPVSDFVCIVKTMIFIKKVYAFPDTNKEHFYNCLVTDMLGIIHSFSKASLRIYFTFLRSTIENLVRVVLGYENKNATGVRNMFSELRVKYDSNAKEFIDYIEGEYGKCCEVIHSNSNAYLTMYEYYEDIVKKDELNSDSMKKIYKQLATFYGKCRSFIIENNCQQVDSAFYNQKEVLCFLVGKINYQLYEYNVKSL